MNESKPRWAIDEPTEAQPSSRRWSFRLIAVLVPSLLGLIAIGWLLVFQERIVVDRQTNRLRLQTPPLYLQEPGHERTGHKYIYDQLLGWRNIPSWSATTNGHPLNTNSHGLRSPECAYDKPAGTRRLLVLGDSFAWGYGVADNAVFSRVLEPQLAAGGTPWEVINTGVSGWGTDQEYLFYINHGVKYDPDVVILALFLINDPANNVAGRQYGLYKPVFLDLQMELANVPVPTPRSFSRWVESRAPAVELTVEIIKSLDIHCREEDRDLVIMKFGRFLAGDDPDYMGTEDAFEALRTTRLKDVAYLELDDAFSSRGISGEQLLVGNDDGHWNAAGHKIVAQILHEFLGQANLLDQDELPAAAD
jgi:lysophospholipase L1-like esterase